MRRHDLQNEAESQENPAAPPADFGENISSLADSDQCVGDELAPPKLAAIPPPFPLWSRMASITTMQSMTSRVRRNV